MPTVLVLEYGKIKVSIYFKDHNPPHVHVHTDDAEAIFLLNTLEVWKYKGFNRRTLARIQAELQSHHEYLLDKWKEYSDA